MRRLGAAVLALTVANLLGGCGTAGGSGGPGGGAGQPSVGRPAETSAAPSDGCPQVSGGPGQRVDYVDFVQAGGRQFVAHLFGDVDVRPSDVGPVEFTVRCSLSELNRQTDKMPPAPRDGDAGLLPAGTTVHAVNGWPPACRLTAQRDGSWQAYLAVDEQSSTARPSACATSAGG